MAAHPACVLVLVSSILVTFPVSSSAADTTPPGAAAPAAAVSRTGAPAAPDSAGRDTVSRHVVRQFPPIEVRAPLYDLRSSQTVHQLSGPALRGFPVDDLADALALKPGVVVQGEELHVRGGRTGELAVNLDGIGLNEPLRGASLDLPLLALRGADLVTGAPEARYGGGLAGVLDLHTLDPGSQREGEWRWTSDGGLGTRYDRVSARVSGPVPLLGLGAVVAGDGMFDDTSLPQLRTQGRHDVAGLHLGWRAENRVLGYVKLAPVRDPRRFSIQTLVSRQVHQPYDPMWSLDGWVHVNVEPKDAPIFSPVPLPGYYRYRAADHLASTDEQQLATMATASGQWGGRRGSLSLGWLRSRTYTSVGGARSPSSIGSRPAAFGYFPTPDPFHVLWGNDNLYREKAGDVLTLRGDGEVALAGESRLQAGVALTYEQVSLFEVERPNPPWSGWDPNTISALDSVRSYRAGAPGGFAYLQGRWQTGGLVLNAGARAEYFTAGREGSHQSLPGRSGGVWSLSPRLGIAYPISVRDVFSLAYVRMQQDPGRDFLYDNRLVITNRQPLGNPALVPSTVISYEAAVKHVFSAAWALQGSLFYRDIFGQIGVRSTTTVANWVSPIYTNEDAAHAMGFEWSLIGHPRAERVGRDGEGRTIELHYTYLVAAGNESRPEGDPYGPPLGARQSPIDDRPLSWDRRHTLLASAAWRWNERWSLAWSTSVGSPLPWTPKQLRTTLTDLALVNSERFGWTENTNLGLQWRPPHALGLSFGLDVRNLFDNRAERAATVDGFPNPHINTHYDDYGAYRTLTGAGGGAYWVTTADGSGYWVPVNDERLRKPPRAIRASVGRSF